MKINGIKIRPSAECKGFWDVLHPTKKQICYTGKLSEIRRILLAK